jgi:uncharacterized membrane protein
MHRSIRVHRRIRRYALRLNLIVGIFWRRFSVYLRRNRPKLYWRATAALAICFGALIGYLFIRYRSELVTYAEVLSGNGTLSQLGIAVGAAMLGVIGIVFSLNLFSIQQVAERGTILTLREYANDWVLRLVYWSLAGFAVLAITAALFGKHLGVYSLATDFVILVAAVLLLKVYFNRAVKFSDPHFTVSKIANRGRKFLAIARRLERAVEAEVRYARRKGQP